MAEVVWLLRNSGYQIIEDADHDRTSLGSAGGGLTVRGRSGDHQVDALGEFAFIPPFSLPIRMSLEAKYYSRTAIGLRPVGLDVARNATC